MPSKSKAPVVILDPKNLKSLRNLNSLIPRVHKDLLLGKIRTARGGKKFRSELKGASEFLILFNELKKGNLLIDISDEKVDQGVDDFEDLQVIEFGRVLSDCDDPHLFTLSYLTGSKTIITTDKRLSACRKALRRSRINNNLFANAKRIGSGRSYLKCVNNKSL